MDEIYVDKFIFSTKERRGNGESAHSPIRVITQIYTLDGELIAEHDPDSFTIEQIIDHFDPSLSLKTSEQIRKIVAVIRS